MTTESLISSMSPGLAADYAQWLIDNPGKAGRLDEIVAMAVAEFRAALESNPETVLDSDEASLPPSCLRHAYNIIIFKLKGEMDQTLSDAESAAAVRADIFLRGIWTESIRAGSETVIQSPSYTQPEVSNV